MRILLVDDQTLFLDSLKGVLGSFVEVQCVATASDGDTAVELFQAEQINVCLIDVGSSRIEWDRTLMRIRDIDPDAKVAALTSRVDEDLVVEMVRRGAKGYLLKDARVSELLWALKRIHMGHEVYAPEVTQIITAHLREYESKRAGSHGSNAEPAPLYTEDSKVLHGLSEREKEVLMLVADGLSNKEIAAVVHVTEGTVKNHVSSVLRKLNLSQRTELVAYAWSHGLKSAPA